MSDQAFPSAQPPQGPARPCQSHLLPSLSLVRTTRPSVGPHARYSEMSQMAVSRLMPSAAIGERQGGEGRERGGCSVHPKGADVLGNLVTRRGELQPMDSLLCWIPRLATWPHQPPTPSPGFAERQENERRPKGKRGATAFPICATSRRRCKWPRAGHGRDRRGPETNATQRRVRPERNRQSLEKAGREEGCPLVAVAALSGLRSPVGGKTQGRQERRTRRPRWSLQGGWSTLRVKSRRTGLGSLGNDERPSLFEPEDNQLTPEQKTAHAMVRKHGRD